MNNLPTIIQETQLILDKSNSLISITNKILTTRSSTLALALQYKPFVQIGHTAACTSVAFSPDGKTALSGGEEGITKLWDIATGREIRTFKGHSNRVTSVAFSPDGKTALSGSRDKSVKLWDIATGKEIRTFEAHTSIVSSVAFSTDGATALSGNWDGSLKLWDVATGREIRTLEGHSDWVTSVTFSPDGKTALLVSGSWDKYDYERGSLKLWDIATGREIRTFNGHSGRATSVTFSPDGKTALSGSWDKTIRLWNISTGKEIRTFKGHSNGVTSVAFSPDGKMALSGSGDSTLKLWDIATGREIRTLEGHIGNVRSVVFSPDGKTALSGSFDKSVKLWDIATGKEIRTFEAHTSIVSSVAFSTDGATALSGNWDGSLKLWDVATGREIRTFEGHSDRVTSVTFSPDGKTALSGSGSWDEYDYEWGSLKLWDIATGREIRTLEGYSGWVSSVAFSPDGKTALSGSWHGSLTLWDIATGREIRTFEAHTSIVSSVAFSPDGQMALFGSSGSLKLWDISTGKELKRMVAFEGGEWVTITQDGYFDHSKNGRQYINVLTSAMSAIAIDDVTYNHYYRPSSLSDDMSNDEWINKLEKNIDDDSLDRKAQEFNPYQDLILELASIFEDYRKDEGLNPNPAIVERWINQFSSHNREVILSEMIHIFKRMYISEQKVDDFLFGLTTNFDLTDGDPSHFWENVSLLNIQQDGESQNIMTEKFRVLILNQFGVSVAINDFSKDHYIYVDDLLFSGMKLRTDLTYFLERAPVNAKMEVIYIGYFKSGEYYVKEKWFKENNQKNIRLNVWRMFELENRNNCHHSSDILMPTEEIMQHEKSVNDFIELQGQWVARNIHQPLHNQCSGNNIFSSEENRQILEKEFTLAGLKINSSIRDQNKKSYWKPLGLSTFKGLGFGAMITTYRNCPNNTPLALWWGDWSDNQVWTPLFNRKTYNRCSINHDQF